MRNNSQQRKQYLDPSPLLARKGFILSNELYNVKGQHIISTPGYVSHTFTDNSRDDVEKVARASIPGTFSTEFKFSWGKNNSITW